MFSAAAVGVAAILLSLTFLFIFFLFFYPFFALNMHSWATFLFVSVPAAASTFLRFVETQTAIVNNDNDIEIENDVQIELYAHR